MADKGQEGSEKVEFETLMAAYPSVMYKIVVKIAQSVLAEAFPQSQNPETRADLCYEPAKGEPLTPEMTSAMIMNMSIKLNWLLAHSFTDAEIPDYEHRKQKPISAGPTKPTDPGV
jgi:hypothetical protein